MSTTPFKRIGEGWQATRAVLLACLLATGAAAQAQAPAAATQAAAPASQADLDKLVGPIALYPDDLVAIILPASTFPLQIVQADRYLDKRKSNAKLPVDESWDDSVKSLLNYPEVVKKMSTDLDWTSDLGEAVVADQAGVLEAVQRFRRQVQTAGNLKSDDKQTIVVEKEVIQIVPANPQVIYVPQYNPTTVVVYGGYSSWGYWPAPYPVYYYPYPPGAAFATGLIWGAAISATWHGGYHAHYGGGSYNSININHNTNINVNNPGQGGGKPWKSDKKPGQVSGAPNRAAPGSRVGDPSGARPSAMPSSRPSNQIAGGNQSGARPADKVGNKGGNLGGNAGATHDRPMNTQPSRGGDAFGGYGSGRDAQMNSARGAASRQSMPAQQRPAGGGGAARGGRGARGR